MRRHSLICRFGTGDSDPVPVVEERSTVTNISFVSDGGLEYGLGSLLGRLEYLGLQPSEVALDLALLATLVFCADTRISRESDAQDGWTREIDLYLPVRELERWNTTGPLLGRTLRFLTGDQWRIFFRRRPNGFENIVPVIAQREFQRFSCVSLFSGGLDSYIGAINLLAAGEAPLFVSHYMDGTTNQHQEMCLKRLKTRFENKDFEALRTFINFGKNLIDESEGESTQRARSFLFFGLGVLVANALGEHVTVNVPENGFISLNVPLDPLRLGALSTRTTHPFYMARFNELTAQLGLRNILANPYRHRTKGEMVAQCSDRQLLRTTAKETMSCSSPAKARWKKLPQGHCGYCVPCLIRRAALSHGFHADDTPYHLQDLASAVLDSGSAEGQHVRSFQLALANLEANPHSANTIIHSPGPLTDVREEWPSFARVYTEGLREVGEIIRRTTVRPGS